MLKIGNIDITPEILEEFRQEKQEIINWLIEENRKAILIKNGLIPDPDQILTAKERRQMKRMRSEIIDVLKLIYQEDETIPLQTALPYVFSLKYSRFSS